MIILLACYVFSFINFSIISSSYLMLSSSLIGIIRITTIIIILWGILFISNLSNCSITFTVCIGRMTWWTFTFIKILLLHYLLLLLLLLLLSILILLWINMRLYLLLLLIACIIRCIIICLIIFTWLSIIFYSDIYWVFLQVITTFVSLWICLCLSLVYFLSFQLYQWIILLLIYTTLRGQNLLLLFTWRFFYILLIFYLYALSIIQSSISRWI